MSIKTVIKRQAVPLLSNLGFIFDDSNSPNIWKFIREEQNQKRIIAIQKSNHVPNTLRIQFSTSLPNTMVYGSQLLEGRSEEHWNIYEDNDGLSNVVRRLLEIAITYGIPYLDQAIIPDLLAPVEFERLLLCNYEYESLKFSKYNYVTFQDSDVIEKLDYIALQRKHETNKIDWEFMIGASAFFGEYIRYNCEGNWVFDELLKAAALTRIYGKPMLKIHPFRWISGFWGKPNLRFKRLSYMFAGLEEFKH
jgi:hypothetical protein